LTNLWFPSIFNYLSNAGIKVGVCTTELITVKDSTVVIHGEDLTPEVILMLKENNNKIVSFDINDSSWFTYTYADKEERKLIDLFFKVGGVQVARFGKELSIDNDFNFKLVTRQFMPEDQFKVFQDIYADGKIISLPYILWNNLDVEPVTYDDKIKKGLVRGGNHFLRFILFLNLMKLNELDNQSAFFTHDYFSPTMPDQFRYCPDCVAEYQRSSILSYNYYINHKFKCSNKYINWQSEKLPEGFFNTDVGQWNNRCVPMFYWLSEQFIKRYGAIDISVLESALNGRFLNKEGYQHILPNYLYYGDLKWLFSIYMPPRFWEAAACNTINLCPSVTADQDYFPLILEPDEHYLSYKEDFSDLREVIDSIDEIKYNRITKNCKEVYDTWVKGDKYPVSDTLLEFIKEKILNV
jgi:hypothetical protein